MPLTIQGNFDLSKLTDLTEHLPEAAVAAATVIKDEAVDRVPKEHGDLAASGRVRGTGMGHAIIEFVKVYAHWIEEGIEFVHPHGGQAKFLASSMIDKVGDAMDKAADVLRRYLQ